MALQILTEPYVDLGRRLCPTEKLLALHPPWIFRPSNGPAITNVINTTTSHSAHIMCQNELLIPEALLFECRSLIEID